MMTLLAAIAVITHDSPAQVPCSYDVTVIQWPSIPTCGLPSTVGVAINNRNEVLGYYTPCAGNRRPYLWSQAAGFTAIPMPPGVSEFTPTDLNDNRVMVGWGNDANGYVYFIDEGRWVTLPAINAPDGLCVPHAINNHNVACGARTFSRPGPLPTQAFTWSEKNGFTDLGVMNGPSSGAYDISDTGIVVGWTGVEGTAIHDDVQPFAYANEKTQVLPLPDGAMSGVANDVGRDGRILIHSKIQSTPTILFRVFLLEDAVYQSLPLPDGFDRSYPAGFGNNGTVIGSCNNSRNPSAGNPGCIWYGTAVTLTGNLFQAPPNTYPNSNRAVNGRGAIVAEVGYGIGIEGTILLTPRPRKPGDTDCDDVVDIDDLLSVIGCWGACAGCAADFNHDGVVNHQDLLVVIGNWTV